MIKKIILLLALIVPLGLDAQTCKDSTKSNPYASCKKSYKPVCACDGKTYRNPCAAELWGGITDAQIGRNYRDGICSNFDFDFVPNPVSAFVNSTSDAFLHIYIDERLLPTSYSVYIFDVFNKVMYQGGGIAYSNNPFGLDDLGTPVRELTADFFARFEKGIYFLIVSVNGEQKARKFAKVNIE